MLKVVTRKLREPPDLRYVGSSGSSDHEYSLGEYYKGENCPVVWKLDEYIPATSKRSIEEYESPEYYSTIKKPFIKTEAETFSDIFENSEEISIEEFDAAVACYKYKDEESEVSDEDLDPSESQFRSDYISDNEPRVELESCSTSLQAEIEDESNLAIDSVQDWQQIPAQRRDARCVLERSFSSSDDDDKFESEIISVTERRSSSPEVLVEAVKTPSVEDPVHIPVVEGNLSVCNFDLGSEARFPGFRQGEVRDEEDKIPSVSPKRGTIRVKKWIENSSTDRNGRDRSKIHETRVVRSRARLQDSPDSPETTYYDARRVTRSCIKNNEGCKSSSSGRYQVGKVVWGYCMGWWPAIIVSGEDAGLEPIEDKVCVYWIGEDLISMLNKKTQVEPFSNNLDTRLLRYLEDKEVSKDRTKASFVTLKLFSKYLEVPLIKPYVSWAEKHLMGKSYLNDVTFIPYPKNMQQRLDQLKKKNKKLSESKVRAKEKSRVSKTSNDLSSSRDECRENLDKSLKENGKKSNKFPKEFVRKSANDLLVSFEPNCMLPLMDQKPGVIVWGKIIGHSWWPAMIIHHHDCGTKEPNFGCQWILWYGDYRLSQVHHQNVMKFDEGILKLQSYITQCKREIYTNAVLRASKDYCARLNYDTSNWTMDDVLSWVSSLGNNLKTVSIPRPDDGRLESRYSIHIAKKLNEIKSNQEVAAERKSKIKNCDPLKAIFAGLTSTLKKLCISCLNICHDKVQDHPFFECVLCNDCMEEFKAAIFAYGDDGKCFYCTLCSGSDTIVMCDGCDCPRVYCTACLKYLICPTEYDEILIKDPWLCFLCVESSQCGNKDRLFKPRLDWKTRIGQLYHTKLDKNWNNVWKSDRQKKKIRVLSLFDGISTGLLALEKLGIIVDKYYASEIDVDARLVGSVYFGNRISHLGDVRNITKDMIARIAPIDLLIGGSPCNDLSLANPNRLGLHDPNGSGVLFFDYCRIKALVTAANKGHHLFWLFENVASMPSRYRIAINESLRQEPSLIDASDFSPQHRPRLFWSNLPIGISFPLPDSSQDLQSVLTPNCDRHALVKKIQTVTTKVNSLKQGVSLLKPVLMEGKPDSLWITELEAIFGLPKHFTDVKNLSATKRQKLIGQSWSVQTITAILRPLSYFFVIKNEAQVIQ